MSAVNPEETLRLVESGILNIKICEPAEPLSIEPLVVRMKFNKKISLNTINET